MTTEQADPPLADQLRDLLAANECSFAVEHPDAEGLFSVWVTDDAGERQSIGVGETLAAALEDAIAQVWRWIDGEQ